MKCPKLVVVAEVESEEGVDLAVARSAIRNAVVAEHEIAPAGPIVVAALHQAGGAEPIWNAVAAQGNDLLPVAVERSIATPMVTCAAKVAA